MARACLTPPRPKTALRQIRHITQERGICRISRKYPRFFRPSSKRGQTVFGFFWLAGTLAPVVGNLAIRRSTRQGGRQFCRFSAASPGFGSRQLPAGKFSTHSVGQRVSVLAKRVQIRELIRKTGSILAEFTLASCGFSESSDTESFASFAHFCAADTQAQTDCSRQLPVGRNSTVR